MSTSPWQTPESLNGLLSALDENQSCRGVLNVERVEAEVSRTLLFQLPASAEIRRRLDQLEGEGLPWVEPFSAMVDALYRHLVAREASRPFDERSVAPARDSREVLDRVAAALSSLGEQAHDRAGLAALLREVRGQLNGGAHDSASAAPAASTPAGRRH